MGIQLLQRPIGLHHRLSCDVRLLERSSLAASTCITHVRSGGWDGFLVSNFLWIGHPPPLRGTIFTPFVCGFSFTRFHLGTSGKDAVGSLSRLPVLDRRARWSPVTSLAREKAVPLPRRHAHLDPQTFPTFPPASGRHLLPHLKFGRLPKSPLS